MDISPTALLGSLESDLRQSSAYDLDNISGPMSFLKTASPKLVAAKMLRDSLLKKFRGGSKSKKAADVAAFTLFEHWNNKCENWCEPKPESEFDQILIGEFRNCFMKCFELPDGDLIDFSSAVTPFFRVGPGAAVDAAMGDLYTKLYAGNLSTTSEDLYWHYYDSTLPFELEHEAERIRSACFETPVVKGSVLGFAAKNASISRVRCTEPSLSMVYQLATGKVLEEVILRRFGVDLATQPDCNRELSRRGSIDGSVSTTDLSSASDATAVKFWKWAMPYRDIHDWFMWIRSDRTKHPFKKGEWTDLNVLSSMGNGYTFPLMTLIFLCVVEAVYKCLGIKLVKNKTVRSFKDVRETLTLPGNFGVFGDDIIVVSEAFELVNHLLVMLGYAVNKDKSFGPVKGHDGPFRESCGTDWFLGHNVRGVYCKSLDRPQNRYTLINRLNAWSAEWDIPLPNTINFLLKTVWYLPVPPWEAADSGVIVPLSCFKSGKRDQYGGFVYSAMRPVVLKWNPVYGLTDRHYHRDGDLTQLRVVDLGPNRPPFVNTFGLLLSAVRGNLSSAGIAIRSNEGGPDYKKTTLTTPGWEYSERSTVGFSPSGWARFEKTLASLNLCREY